MTGIWLTWPFRFSVSRPLWPLGVPAPESGWEPTSASRKGRMAGGHDHLNARRMLHPPTIRVSYIRARYTTPFPALRNLGYRRRQGATHAMHGPQISIDGFRERHSCRSGEGPWSSASPALYREYKVASDRWSSPGRHNKVWEKNKIEKDGGFLETVATQRFKAQTELTCSLGRAGARVRAKKSLVCGRPIHALHHDPTVITRVSLPLFSEIHKSLVGITSRRRSQKSPSIPGPRAPLQNSPDSLPLPYYMLRACTRADGAMPGVKRASRDAPEEWLEWL
jgi:hypothetical protein